ncbi:MAG: class I SAM-dependent methyltransferase [Candidatus Woesearchaeota archaeon]
MTTSTPKKSGSFSKDDVASLQQSVRKDGCWVFFRRNIKAISQKKSVVITELGCGMGANVILSKRIPNIKTYFCIDASEDMLEYVRREQISYAKTLCVDLDTKNYALPKSDIVLAKFLFHHISNKQRLLEKIHASLAKDGVVLIIDKFPKRWGIVYEKLLHTTRIRKQLGVHYYINQQDFESLCEAAGFSVSKEKVVVGKKLKNCHIYKVFYVLKKQ